MAEGVLGKIAAVKRQELVLRYDGMSLESLRARARPTQRSLVKAIAKGGARFILEIKKASPSAGAIRVDGDPAALARGYAGVADALSVLCDRTFFGGFHQTRYLTAIQAKAPSQGSRDQTLLAILYSVVATSNFDQQNG